MGSGWNIDRDRLTGRGRGGGFPGVVVGAGLVMVAMGAVWFFLLQTEDQAPVDTTTSPPTPSTTVTSSSTTPPDSTSTETAPPVATTVAVAPGSIPILSEDQAYLGDQARLVWLPGVNTGWIVDMAAGTAGAFGDVPPGARGDGFPVRDGSLIITVDGRVMRRTPDGQWVDISPAADRSYRVLDAGTGSDHLHLYLLESGGSSDRLLNVMYLYETPNELEEKWAVDGSGVARVGTSLASQLVLVELSSPGPQDPPGYLLLSEETGGTIRRTAFPQSDPPELYVWAVEFTQGTSIFWMRCENVASFDACGTSEGMITDLGSGATIPVLDLYRGWSVEWESVGQIPSFSHSYGDVSLLVRTNVDLGHLQTGERTRLISARDL